MTQSGEQQDMLLECLYCLHSRLLSLEAIQGKALVLGELGTIWDIMSGIINRHKHEVYMTLDEALNDDAKKDDAKVYRLDFYNGFTLGKRGVYFVKIDIYPFYQRDRQGGTSEISQVILKKIEYNSEVSAAIPCKVCLVNAEIKHLEDKGETLQKNVIIKFRSSGKEESKLLAQNEIQNALYITRRPYLKAMFTKYYFMCSFEDGKSGDYWEGLCMDTLERQRLKDLNTWFYKMAYELMHNLHTHGAIHGDAHYGNFMNKKHEPESGDKRKKDGEAAGGGVAAGGSVAVDQPLQLLFIDSDSFSIFAEDTTMSGGVNAINTQRFIKLNRECTLSFRDIHKKHEDVHFDKEIFNEYKRRFRQSPALLEHSDADEFLDYIHFYQAKYMCAYDYNKLFIVSNMKMPMLRETGRDHPVPPVLRVGFFQEFFKKKFKKNEKNNTHSLLYMPFYFGKNFNGKWEGNAVELASQAADFPNWQAFFRGLSLYDVESFYHNLFFDAFEDIAKVMNNDAKRFWEDSHSHTHQLPSKAGTGKRDRS